MAILKYKDVEKMNSKERTGKLLDLEKEIIRSKVKTGKDSGKIKVKEVKKAIARILTFENTKKKEDTKDKNKEKQGEEK